MNSVLLSSSYWPNLHYCYFVLNAEKVMIEQHEHYVKQSFRNRTQILSANGVLDLNIPVKRGEENISRVEISYKENWQIRHWRAITSAYKNSPYFEYFEDEIRPFYDREHPLLLDFNQAQLQTILKILRIRKEIFLTSHYEKEPDAIDLRSGIHPKKSVTETIPAQLLTPYYQTFQQKFGFIPNLSILDLLFNTGLETLDYLKKKN